MKRHTYPRTERDLRWIAVSFTSGNITRGLPERLECLAAYHRTVVEAEKASNGQQNEYHAASRAYEAAIFRLRQAGVDESSGELTFSPCCGPDAPSSTSHGGA